MPKPSAQTRSARALLLGALRDTSAVRRLTDEEWDVLVRAARASRLLGTLHARMERTGMLAALPAEVRQQIGSDRVLCDYRRQMVFWELNRVARTLAPLGVTIVLLKGAAYLTQNLVCAEGRLLSDVDLLVPRSRLQEVEHTLL